MTPGWETRTHVQHRAPRLPALRRLRGARRPRQHKQACGAGLPAAASAPDPGGGARKHPGPQAFLPLAWKTLPPGEGSPWKKSPRGLQHFPGPSEANPEDRGSPQDPPATPGPGSSLPRLGADTPARPRTPVLSGSPMQGRAGHPQGPCPSTGSLGCTAGLQTPPGTPAPGAQRVTTGAAGGRPRQTPTRHPRTPLTTPPPACEHSLPRAARAWALRAVLGPPPLQLCGLRPPPPYRRGGGRCGPGRVAGSAASWAAPSLRWRFQDNTRATGSQRLKL